MYLALSQRVGDDKHHLVVQHDCQLSLTNILGSIVFINRTHDTPDVIVVS